MKRTLKIFLIILAVLVVLVIAAYAYLGGFTSVTIAEQQMGPFTIVYKDMVGADMAQLVTMANTLRISSPLSKS